MSAVPDRSSPGPRYLLVLGEYDVITRELPARGVISIGRDLGCDVTLSHHKISRRHACLHFDGTREVEVEDLGSTNGTRVGTRRIVPGERVPVPIGGSVRIGPYAVVVLGSYDAIAPTADSTRAGGRARRSR